MKASFVLSGLAALVVSLTGAQAHEFKIGELTIEHPWARATPKGAEVGGGYMVIHNHGATPDRLIGGSVTVASTVQVHEMSMEGAVMHMHQLAGGLEIPAGGTVALKPASYHLMFMGLNQPLREGDKVSGELRFEHAGTVHVEFLVGNMGGTMPQDPQEQGYGNEHMHDHGAMDGMGHDDEMGGHDLGHMH